MLARKGIPSIGTSVKVKHIHTDPLCICHFEQLEIPLKLLMLPHCWLRCKSFDLARKEMSLGPGQRVFANPKRPGWKPPSVASSQEMLVDRSVAEDWRQEFV